MPSRNDARTPTNTPPSHDRSGGAVPGQCIRLKKGIWLNGMPPTPNVSHDHVTRPDELVRETNMILKRESGSTERRQPRMCFHPSGRARTGNKYDECTSLRKRIGLKETPPTPNVSHDHVTHPELVRGTNTILQCLSA
jgi:hypothetical protein